MLLIYVPLDIVPIYVNMDKVRLIRPIPIAMHTTS